MAVEDLSTEYYGHHFSDLEHENATEEKRPYSGVLIWYVE
jgi:hypothetical protein